MDENRVEGTARKYGGRVQEAVGSVTGDTKTRVEGAMNEAAGAAQQLSIGDAEGLRKLRRELDHAFLVPVYETIAKVRSDLPADVCMVKPPTLRLRRRLLRRGLSGNWSRAFVPARDKPGAGTAPPLARP